MERSTRSSNDWLVWAQQLSVLTKLTPKLVCISSHQARKLLLIPHPLLSVHVCGISCSFIGRFPWSSHELISPKDNHPRREVLIQERSCSRRKPFHIFSFLHESNSVQEYRLCHSLVSEQVYLRSIFKFLFLEGAELFHFNMSHTFTRSRLRVLTRVISHTNATTLYDGRYAGNQYLFIRIN